MDLPVKVFDLVFEDLRVIVTDRVQHLRAFVKDVRVGRVPNFEEFVLLLYEQAIVHKGITRDKVESISRCLLLQAACQKEEERAEKDWWDLIS